MNKPYLLKFLILWAFISFVGSYSALAQSAKTAAVVDLKLDSAMMGREMPYRVILPAGYDSPNEKRFYPAVYLLHGLTGHFDDWSKKTELTKYASGYDFIIVMPEGENGWYTDSPTLQTGKFESYITDELIPEIEKKFRADGTRESRVIAGLSMGGYGALKFGLKHPRKFILAGSFSGALRAAEWDPAGPGSRWKLLVDSIMAAFGPNESETRAKNDLFSVLSEKDADGIKLLPFLYLDCGTEDGLFKQNLDFADLLVKRKVPHEFRQRPGGHDWRYWDRQIREFLRLADELVGPDPGKRPVTIRAAESAQLEIGN